jgi:hypothetical protein
MKTISSINSSLTNLVYVSILAGLVLAFVDPAPRARQQAAAATRTIALVNSNGQLSNS